MLINHHRHYCNCRCTYCPFWNVKPKPPLFSIADILQSLMAQEVIADACTFAWGGGESTLLPEFDEQVILLAGRGYRQFIHTNAVRFSPAIAEVLRRGQAVVNVSLDIGDAAGYARIKGIDAWDQVIENLGRYRQQLVRPDALEIKYIINRDSAHPHAIQRFFDTCRRLDIKRVLYAFDITDRPWEPNSLSARPRMPVWSTISFLAESGQCTVRSGKRFRQTRRGGKGPRPLPPALPDQAVIRNDQER